jgi:riboflavin biosynthesis pyrimidine reductase
MRVNILKKPSTQPLLVVISNTGDFPLDRPCFGHSDQAVLILTSPEGKRDLTQRLAKSAIIGQLQIEEFVGSAKDLVFLLKGRGINLLDVSSGGRMIRSFIDAEILDEIRMTKAGQLIGSFNSVGGKRPSLFPEEGKSYSPHNSPLVSWRAIRTVGEYFIFFRGMFKYRSTSQEEYSGVRDL